jgi:pre-mRNA-splicing factor SPF27
MPSTELRPQINSLIAVELRNILPKTVTQLPINLSHLSSTPRSLIPSNSSTLLSNELKRFDSKKSTMIPTHQGLDTTRYALPSPTSESASLSEWESAHSSSLAQLEHTRLRLLNTQLLTSLGPNAWRIQNFSLETTVAHIEAEAEESRKEVEKVNRERKRMQESGGVVLGRMEKKWTELISGNIQLEIGCLAM